MGRVARGCESFDLSWERFWDLVSQSLVMAESAPGEVPVGTSSFEEIYATHRARLIRVAFLATGSSATAEDITQEAFLRLHEHFEDVENPGGFLRTVVVRLCSTWRTRQVTASRALSRVIDPLPLGEPRIDSTWEVLARLKPERRLALVLRFYEDLDYAQIAALQDCTVITARTRVHRGLADLRKELER
jgi:RNA polymerase sigma factor (sigma-70 family)